MCLIYNVLIYKKQSKAIEIVVLIYTYIKLTTYPSGSLIACTQ